MKNLSVKAIIMAIAISLFAAGCGQTGTSNLKIPGVTGPTVSLLNDSIMISVVFDNFVLDGGVRYAIPKYPNSYLELGPDLESAGTLLAVSVSLKDVFAHIDGGFKLLDAQKLPGGRALPGVMSGQLPAVAFSIEKLKNVSIYLGTKVFGIFVPVNFDIGVNNIITARYYINNKRGGNLSMIGKDENGQNSGFLLLIDLGTAEVKQLRKIAAQY